MKKRMIAVLTALVLLLSCCTGCALFETEYTYAEPYAEPLNQNTGDAIEIRNYSMLKAAILDMINSHKLSAELRFSNYNGVVSDDLAAVCLEIKSANPMGAYAVDTLTYDSSRIVSYYMAEVHISYKKTAEEIRSIHSVVSGTELESYLRDEVLAASAAKAAVRSYAADLNEESIAAMLEKIYFSDPVRFVIPVSAVIETYPKDGNFRIYEITLDYQEIPAQRGEMSETMKARIAELLQPTLPETPAAKAWEIARRLSGSLTEAEGDYRSTAYGALAENSADSLGVALAYSALCREAGIECSVVRGSIGAMGTEEHYWNMLGIDGEHYHADISRFAAEPQSTFLMDDAAFWGTYIWDTEAYPACSGPLRYADAAPAEDAEKPEENGEAESGEQPEETPEPTEEPLPEEEQQPPDEETMKIRP